MRNRFSISIKVIACLLALFLLQGSFEISGKVSGYDEILASLTAGFNQKKYRLIIPEIEKLLNEIGEEHSQIRGKFFLLLGAAYEKTKNKDAAVENYLLGDMLLDDPVLAGIDFSKMEIYQSTFHGKIIGGRRVYEKVGKRKRKKKFPVFTIVGIAALAVTVFLLMKKKKEKIIPEVDKQMADEILNSIEWVVIPAGAFRMGDTHGDGETDELPSHVVAIDLFKISKFEITLAQFRKFMYLHPEINSFYRGTGENHPVTHVRRDEVDVFCRWLREVTGKDIRLPTEAQWEKAAKGIEGWKYPWGNELPDCSILNYNHCTGGTQPVGSYTGDRSYFGVMDMGGNVSEMVYDAYSEHYYSVSPASNPRGPEFSSSDYRVVRGGNWQSGQVRASDRSSIYPAAFREYLGFRIVWID